MIRAGFDAMVGVMVGEGGRGRGVQKGMGTWTIRAAAGVLIS